MRQFKRQEIIDLLQEKLNKGFIVIASGAGTGISAKFEEEGGSDIIMVFNSGKYRMNGLGSLSGWMAYGNANEISIEMGERSILPVVKNTPVICSLNGTDPTFIIENLIERVIKIGFSGINNFPTIGMIDGKFREALEETGISYQKEVDMIAMAHERDIFTMAYAFNAKEAESMAKGGCDVVIAHVGLTTGGSIGARKSITFDTAINVTKEIYNAVKSINKNTFVFCHGGPIVSPEDVEKVLNEVPVEGFVGASSMERIPVEKAISEITSSFSRIKRKN